MDINQAIDLIRGTRLCAQADSLIQHLLPSARVIVDNELGGSVNDFAVSHFGGLPSLPHDCVWPVWDRRNYLSRQIARLEEQFRANPRAIGLRDNAQRMRQDLPVGPIPLPFLGQLALAEIYAAAPLPGWPHDGTLVFFCDSSAWGYDPSARGHCRALFFPPRADLAPAPAPTELPNEARSPLRRLHFRREWTLPTRIISRELDLSIWSDDAYRGLCQQLMPDSHKKHDTIHRCGGHPQEIQGDMRLECQLVTNGIYCGDQSGYQDPRRYSLEKGAADWQLLLQIDSDEKRLGWMWGDSGRVYFWARQQDIAATDFDGSWAVLHCY
jgi:hypothetical protein